MASYQGGKQKIGKHIHAELVRLEQKYSNTPLEYLEPFVGFCGIIKHFSEDEERKLNATDINPDLVEMWRALQNGWIPDGYCNVDKWNRLKNQEFSTPEKTLYGHVCSFGGIYFNYFINKSTRDYAKSGTRSILKIKDKIKNVNFMDAISYDQLTPENMLIYCDPPYKHNQLSNKLFNNFDHDQFWETMRKWSKNNIVVVSEYIAPDDFMCIWEKDRPNSTSTIDKKRSIEKLFNKQ